MFTLICGSLFTLYFAAILIILFDTGDCSLLEHEMWPYVSVDYEDKC